MQSPEEHDLAPLQLQQEQHQPQPQPQQQPQQQPRGKSKKDPADGSTSSPGKQKSTPKKSKAASRSASTSIPAPAPSEGPLAATGTSVFPTARMQRIIKSDEDLTNCSAEAAFLIAIATECFIKYFVEESYASARMEKRKAISYKDCQRAVQREWALGFLQEAVPATMPLSVALKKAEALEASALRGFATSGGTSDMAGGKPSHVNGDEEMFSDGPQGGHENEGDDDGGDGDGDDDDDDDDDGEDLPYPVLPSNSHAGGGGAREADEARARRIAEENAKQDQRRYEEETFSDYEDDF
ncbi:unnamed protein product [Tilletia laevis]|uniref:Transcription factor CBF/NF-Y/archaeal histone domain-containing protein n=2 Tax=Tilletia TaxID=13289 RepID=A0A177V0B7_9BASI|nr:hypothetical protein CF336_g3775 [Tilletia laevis]KAE8261565.1 hypothetical protein A4X03_0g3144 [Tilletia caries]CAD6938761.1 unnamed protein product [Tilletia controversa]KAE8203765.1 hypothetical protein CF335_g2899 [Tilletia laevis]CAD6888225.1 unnamed protein product [Tilletia caries]